MILYPPLTPLEVTFLKFLIVSPKILQLHIPKLKKAKKQNSDSYHLWIWVNNSERNWSWCDKKIVSPASKILNSFVVELQNISTMSGLKSAPLKERQDKHLSRQQWKNGWAVVSTLVKRVGRDNKSKGVGESEELLSRSSKSVTTHK